MVESRPSPALYSSADVRPLKMDDFKYAHEQVLHEIYKWIIWMDTVIRIINFCNISYTWGYNHWWLCCRCVQVYHQSPQIWMSSFNGMNYMEKVDREKGNLWATLCRSGFFFCIAFLCGLFFFIVLNDGQDQGPLFMENSVGLSLFHCNIYRFWKFLPFC